MDYKLGKRYSLKGKKLIDSTFNEGIRLKSYPYTAIIKEVEFKDETPFKLVFSAPKRTFRLSTKRSRIKRIMREAFRHNKSNLDDYLRQNNKQLAIFLVYSSKDELDHLTLGKRTHKLIDKIIKTLDESHE